MRLTKNQKAILDFLRSRHKNVTKHNSILKRSEVYIKTPGTIISKELNIPYSVVSKSLRRLYVLGLIKRENNNYYKVI